MGKGKKGVTLICERDDEEAKGGIKNIQTTLMTIRPRTMVVDHGYSDHGDYL